MDQEPPEPVVGAWSIVGRSGWIIGTVVALALPLVLVAVLRGLPRLDARWENTPAHFWLVGTAAVASMGLALGVRQAATERRDARLLLISLAFVASAGFLALHALATPGVLVSGKNTGFVVASPVGLVVAGGFAAVSAVEFDPATGLSILRRSGLLTGGLLALLALWAAVSLAQVGPLSPSVSPNEARGPLVALAGVGVGLYLAAAMGYLRLYRRRQARLVFVVSVAFALLAEALIVVVAALPTSWRLTWWEWHLLMLGGFGFVVYSAYREWHQERFSALYLDETLAGAEEVSILFADLAGFTRFCEERTPADVRRMLNTYFGRVVPLLHDDFGGQIHQIIGDAIMAIFNARADQPDHAERACRAALAVQAESAGIAARHPEWPRFRVGVNSGEVATGLVGAERGLRKHDVTGDTVNLAARLQSHAATGGVLIGAGTFARLPDGVEVERLPQLEVKGKTAPVEAYSLKAMPQGRAAR